MKPYCVRNLAAPPLDRKPVDISHISLFINFHLNIGVRYSKCFHAGATTAEFSFAAAAARTFARQLKHDVGSNRAMFAPPCFQHWIKWSIACADL